MEHARVTAHRVAVGPAGNLLTVVFDVLANLIMVGVALMFLYGALGERVTETVSSVVDPSGSASSDAYHFRTALVGLLLVGVVATVYFGAGWRRFRSSLGLRMMRVFGVLPSQPRFPTVKSGRSYVLRFAIPTALIAWAIVAGAVWLS